MKAIVIGGGLAGLAAGFRLHAAHWEILVLEKAAMVGGRATTSHKGGYLLENGATQLSTGFTAYLALAAEVGLGDRIRACGNTICLLRNGKLYEIDGSRPWELPFSGALGLASKIRTARAILDFLAIKPPIDVLDLSASHRLDGESAQTYCLRRLNREIYDVLVDPAIRCYTLNRGDRVSALEWFSFLRNLAGQHMLAIRGGIGSLSQSLAATLDVRTNCTVVAVNTSSRGVTVTYRDSAGGPKTMQADACVIATQLPEATELAPELVHAMAPLAEPLTYNRAVLVHLGFRKRTSTQALGVLVGTVEHPQIALVWLEHNKLPEAAPAGHSLFTIYFEESGLDSVEPNIDSRFVNIALAFVTRLFPEIAGECDLQQVVRWQRAIPHPAPGIYAAIHQMKLRLDPSARIQLAGDYFTCTGQNSAIHWGKVAADNLIRSHAA